MTPKNVIQASVEFTTFLMAAEDYGTHHGKIEHWGTALREVPFGRTRMGWKHWVEYQTVGPNTKWSGGPECSRRFTGRDAGWVLKRNWKVFDLDEVKDGRSRTRDEIIAELPGNMYCLVPTKTPGHYQAWYYFDEPINDEQSIALNPHVARWGDDGGYSDNTLAWNPIYRSLNPNSRGEVTWWNPDIALGVMPTVSVSDLFHPDYQEDSVVYLGKGGTRISLGDLVERMSIMVDGEGRHNALRLYIYKVGKQGLTRDEIQSIADQGNLIFAEQKTQASVDGLVDYFVKATPWKHQSNRVKKLNTVKKLDADLRYQEYLSKLDALVNINTLTSNGVRHLFADDEFKRAVEYEGKPGTRAHLAYTLDVSINTVKLVLSRGRKRAA